MAASLLLMVFDQMRLIVSAAIARRGVISPDAKEQRPWRRLRYASNGMWQEI
jgi:hypothetical protein